MSGYTKHTMANGRKVRTDPRKHRGQAARLRTQARTAEHEEALRDPTQAD